MSPRGGNGGVAYDYPARVEETHGPWVGVMDGPAETEGDAQHAEMIRNGYLPDPGRGAVVPRPGIRVLNGARQLGTPASRTPQGIATWRPPSGAPVTYAFVGGRMYRVPTPGDSGLTPITDVTPGNVQIAVVVPIYAVNFSGKLIVNDGYNPPWVWDGTTATAINFGVGQSLAFGAPTVYYDQLFFIQATSLSAPTSTLVWSEVNNPTLGYVQTVGQVTFADDWILEQTGTDPIMAIVGTNDGLYYWRKNSTGAIYGQVGTNFSTTGTHDAISSTIGLMSVDTIAVTDREIYFLDQHGLPQALERYGQIVPLWRDALQTFVGPFASNGYIDSAVFFSDLQVVAWAMPGPSFNGTLPGQMAVFDVRTKKYLGFWKHATSAGTIDIRRLARVEGVFNRTTGSTATTVYHLDATGNLYAFDAGVQAQGGAFDASVYAPGTPAPSVNQYAIELQVTPSQMVLDAWSESVFDRLQWVTLPYRAIAAAVDYTTPRLPAGTFSTAQSVTQTVSGGIVRSEVTVGLNTTARYLIPRFTNQPQTVLAAAVNRTPPASVGVVQVHVRAFRVDQNPGSP